MGVDGKEDPPPVLPPTAAEVAHLRTLIEELKKTKDADTARIAQLETRLEAAEKKLVAAKENVKAATMLDLF